MIVLITAIFAASLALILGIALAVFRKAFHVETDVLSALIRETLPGANCGACGFPGCDGFASAVADKSAAPTLCTVSSAEDTKKRGAILGMEVDATPRVAHILCRGTVDHAKLKGEYTGAKNCTAAKISAGGTKQCKWACLGYGDCAATCTFGAITEGKNGIPVIDKEKCGGCGRCASVCPQGVIKLLPRTLESAYPICSNRNAVKTQVRKTCTAGCIKCETCVRKCPEGAVSFADGLPVIDSAKCTLCGTCVTACPVKVLTLLTDEARVERKSA